MSRWLKLLIGLLVALFVAWLVYGPLGRGSAYIDVLQQRADAVLRYSEIPNLQARMSRAPLARTVFLCGPSNDFQRGGTEVWDRGATDLPGIDGLMLYAGGIGRVVWDPAPPTPRAATPACRPDGPGAGGGGGLPLLAEWLGLALPFWLIGLGIGWLIRRRRPRRGYLG